MAVFEMNGLSVYHWLGVLYKKRLSVLLNPSVYDRVAKSSLPEQERNTTEVNTGSAAPCLLV